MLYLKERPELRTHYAWVSKDKKKAQHPGFKPYDLKSFAPQLCALLLCYNRCQRCYGAKARSSLSGSEFEPELSVTW